MKQLVGNGDNPKQHTTPNNQHIVHKSSRVCELQRKESTIGTDED